jgi:hypothetical protein
MVNVTMGLHPKRMGFFSEKLKPHGRTFFQQSNLFLAF